MSQTQYFDAAGNPVDPDELNQQGRMAQVPRKVIRRLEKEAEEGRKLAAENEQLKRERAFVKAGIPLDDKRAAYFIAGYTGDQDPEAIKQEWNESFGSGTAGTNSPIASELAAQSAADNLVSGEFTPPPDLLAQRNAELAALSDTDPRYSDKYNAIFAKYGGVMARQQ